tara:strand:- start:742 stop:1368 length:627 start_codon:yes stop_codon:yes gene_type:complete
MRISDGAKGNMKREILEDLYGKAEKILDQRRSAIAERSRELDIIPYQELIDQLPKELLSHTKSHRIKINYKIDSTSITTDLSEYWECRFDSSTIGFNEWGDRAYYGDCRPSDSKLHPTLYKEGDLLATDIIALTEERKELEKFLKETLDKWSGPKQLKTVWPESLHKYLPVMKARAPNTAKKISEVPAAATAPSTLNTRLTTNLLEGA